MESVFLWLCGGHPQGDTERTVKDNHKDTLKTSVKNSFEPGHPPPFPESLLEELHQGAQGAGLEAGLGGGDGSHGVIILVTILVKIKRWNLFFLCIYLSDKY